MSVMNNEQKELDNSIEFVATHYKEGFFSPSSAWKRIIGNNMARQRRWQMAAASIVCAVVAASAYVFYGLNLTDSTDHTPSVKSVEKTDVPMTVVSARLEFEDAPIEEVASAIEATYGVKLSNLPDYDVRLTLSYEGSAEDVVEAINSTADLQIVIIENNKD